MVGIIGFHIVMLVLGVTVASQVIPLHRVGNVLGYLHKSIGITTPPMEQARMVALIWIGSIIIIVDACLLLLVSTARLSRPG